MKRWCFDCGWTHPEFLQLAHAVHIQLIVPGATLFVYKGCIGVLGNSNAIL